MIRQMNGRLIERAVLALIFLIRDSGHESPKQRSMAVSRIWLISLMMYTPIVMIFFTILNIPLIFGKIKYIISIESIAKSYGSIWLKDIISFL